jgi:hypothetical protein
MKRQRFEAGNPTMPAERTRSDSMTASWKPQATPPCLALALTLAMFAGCGGKTTEIDTAETIKTEPAVKPTPTPPPAPESTPTPPAEPAKDAPKG